MKAKEDGGLIHRGACDCVRAAFHIVDGDKELHGLAYDEKGAKVLKRRMEAKNVGLVLAIEKRNVFTIARHVDEHGRMS